MPKYEESFKAEVVRRMSGVDALSVRDAARRTGVSPAQLSQWLAAARRLGVVKKNADGTRTPEEKARLLIEALRLDGEERGAFMRREGLFEADIVEWQKALVRALDDRPVRRESRERSFDQRRIVKLEGELKEARALLELKKKVAAIWGDGDAATKPKKEK